MTAFTEPDEIVDAHTPPEDGFETYQHRSSTSTAEAPTAHNELGPEISDEDLERIKATLDLNEMSKGLPEGDPAIKKIERAQKLLRQLPVAIHQLIINTETRDGSIVVYDDQNLVHILEVLRQPKHQGPGKRSFGGWVLGMVQDQFHNLTPDREVKFSTEKLQDLKSVFADAKASEHKVVIPPMRITFSDSLPGAAMTSEEAKSVQESGFGSLQDRHDGSKGVEVWLHADVKKVLDESGPHRLELWERIKPYFVELSTFLSELSSTGIYTDNRLLDLNEDYLKRYGADSALEAWLAVRGMVLNIASIVADFKSSVMGDYR